jgi:hypothetical protein
MHDVLIVAAIFGTLGWIVYTISTNIRRSKASRMQAEVHSKLLDRFSASQELLAYLQSPAGRKFLESETREGSQPWSRVLSAIQAGCVLSLVGAAELIVRTLERNGDLAEFLLITGAIALAIGLGFLVSAAAAFLLSKSYGLLTPSESLK